MNDPKMKNSHVGLAPKVMSPAEKTATKKKRRKKELMKN